MKFLFFALAFLYTSSDSFAIKRTCEKVISTEEFEESPGLKTAFSSRKRDQECSFVAIYDEKQFVIEPGARSRVIGESYARRRAFLSPKKNFLVGVGATEFKIWNLGTNSDEPTTVITGTGFNSGSANIEFSESEEKCAYATFEAGGRGLSFWRVNVLELKADGKAATINPFEVTTPGQVVGVSFGRGGNAKTLFVTTRDHQGDHRSKFSVP
jgi:hypothetical protein